MSTARSPIVVAIAGTSGSGKSSLVQALVKRLGKATGILFDDYGDAPGSKDPGNLRTWLQQGSDPDAWSRPVLAHDLAVLRSGASIVHPRDRTPVRPEQFIILEEPFGRSRTETALYIDFLLFIDLPADVALARRLARIAMSAKQTSLGRLIHDHVVEYMEGGVREAYQILAERAREKADLIVYGMQPTAKICDQAERAIRQAFPIECT